MKEFEPGCQRPAGLKPELPAEAAADLEIKKGDVQKMIKVGKPAPNFSAPAFYKGKFGEVSLADYQGKWVMLCFYPGDFTFV